MTAKFRHQMELRAIQDQKWSSKASDLIYESLIYFKELQVEYMYIYMYSGLGEQAMKYGFIQPWLRPVPPMGKNNRDWY